MRRLAPQTLAARAKAQQGMSLVEATIILMIIFLLTAVLSPTISDYVSDARQVKAKEDIEAIGTSLVRLLRDVGHPFLLNDPTLGVATRYNKANRIDIAVGPGNIPAINTTTYPDFNGGTETATNALNWDDAIDDDVVDDLADHLNANTPGNAGNFYTHPVLPPPAGSGGPRTGIGWRGAYLSNLTPDPWGFRYSVNSVFFAAAADASVVDKGWNYDVVVISFGANGTVDTRFDRQAHVPGVDDVSYVISGSTR